MDKLEAADSTAPHALGRSATATLTIGAIGVVFGDIGTSPLYAYRLALAQTAGGGIDRGEIFGVLSLAIWALTLVVTVKYVLFLMRADNNGEGGVLSLMALAQRATNSATGRSTLIVALGAAGAALFYGDAIITPALSVLSAVEGLGTVPSLAHVMTPSIILLITVVTLVALFAIQAHGTASVAKLFGPVCVVWFLWIGTLGVVHIVDNPAILGAINPAWGIRFMTNHGVIGLFVLGAVFLTVTGGEALTADMGHFGRLPIRIGWFALAMPALMLNYFGQGAFALTMLEAATRAHAALGDTDWFFLMSPDALRVGLVIIATFATVIASQAVITGAYSLTQQAIALGLLPRMEIRQTSEEHAGQIYIPVVNWLLLIGVLALIAGFRTSAAMASAYGIAVTGTMVITTMLAFIVIWKLWKWRLPLAVAFIAPLLALDLVFFGANILRVVEGGWVPLLVAAIIGGVVYTWIKGRALLADATYGDGVPLVDLAAVLAKRPPRRVDGTAVFLSSEPTKAPTALLHNIKHNHVLHRQNVIVTVAMGTRPRVAPEKRLSVVRIDDNFAHATLHYGYMEQPDMPSDLLSDGRVGGLPGGTSFFIGRNSVGAAHRRGMPFIQDVIFIFLQKNASDPTAFFRIPPNRVVELGTRVEI